MNRQAFFNVSSEKQAREIANRRLKTKKINLQTSLNYTSGHRIINAKFYSKKSKYSWGNKNLPMAIKNKNP